MKLFEDLGATLGGGAKVVTNKAKEISGVAAIKTQIGTAEASLGKLYKELGKAYFEDHKDSAEYEDQMIEIKAVLDKIDSLKAKLGDIQNTKLCPVCGKAVPNSNAFCPDCGAKLEAVEAVEVSETTEE